MPGKKRKEVPATSRSGEGEAGREFDPTAPACDEPERSEERGRGPVSHGTPLAPRDYERLKERARRDAPPEGDEPAQEDGAT